MEWDAFYSVQRVDMASDHEIFSMSSGSTVFSEKMSLNEQARNVSGAGKAVPGTAARNISSGQMSSIDSVLASSPARSPVSEPSDVGTDTKSESSGPLKEILLETRIPVGVAAENIKHRRRHESSETSDTTATTVSSNNASTSITMPEVGTNSHGQTMLEEKAQTASLRHVLTQAIILQEFILELAAALQIRATLFDEVELS